MAARDPETGQFVSDDEGYTSYSDLEVQNLWSVAKWRGDQATTDPGPSVDITEEVDPVDGNLERNELAELVAMYYSVHSAQNQPDLPAGGGMLAWVKQLSINGEDSGTPDFLGQRGVDVDQDGTDDAQIMFNSDDDPGVLFRTQGATWEGVNDGANGVGISPTPTGPETGFIDFRAMAGHGPIVDRTDEITDYTNLNPKGNENIVEVTLNATLYWQIHEAPDRTPF